jgi:hypothetical protein
VIITTLIGYSFDFSFIDQNEFRPTDLAGLS